MSLPPPLEKKIVARLEELIDEGREIHRTIRTIPGEVQERWVSRRDGPYQQLGPDRYVVDWGRFTQWATQCTSVLAQVVPENHIHMRVVQAFSKLRCGKDQLEWGIAKLRGINDDFQRNFLGDLALQVEAEVASDYMGQADQLMMEGQSGKFDHVPAAVLAGAVFEKMLKTLCEKHTPPLSTIDKNERPLRLSTLIDTLKKAGVFNEAKAKQLRAWADIRNLAAHGEFGEFRSQDVQVMIAGIKDFVSQFIR